MKLTFLGTGTSYGVPYVACHCAVCTSSDPHNKRLRCSVLVEHEKTRLLVDTTPDLRQQLLRAQVEALDGVLWTHTHADHIVGMDDLRPISDHGGYIDGFGSPGTLTHLQHLFGYAFQQGRTHGGFPRLNPCPREALQPFTVGPLQVTPLLVQHGMIEIYGYRFESGGRSLCYITDTSHLPPDTLAAVRGTDVLVLGALRHRAHPAHFTVQQALEVVTQVRPWQCFFTHIAHDLDHQETNRELPPGVRLAYDMQVVEW